MRIESPIPHLRHLKDVESLLFWKIGLTIQIIYVSLLLYYNELAFIIAMIVINDAIVITTTNEKYIKTSIMSLFLSIAS